MADNEAEKPRARKPRPKDGIDELADEVDRLFGRAKEVGEKKLRRGLSVFDRLLDKYDSEGDGQKKGKKK